MSLGNPDPGGLFAKIVTAFEGTPGLTSADVQVWAFDFVVAGYLSTTYLIGNGMRNLLQNPLQLVELRDDPSLMDRAINEMMRYDGPVQLIDRVAANDTKIGGQKFKAGEWVSAVVGSANHDETKYSCAEEFNIKRIEEDDLGFGWGIHRCIGEPLVKLVAPVAFRKLLERFPNLERAGEPQWQTDPYLRALTNLPLKL
jgi:cytochrome P450